MDFARTLRKIVVAVSCSALLVMVFGGSVLAAPRAASGAAGATPNYIPCSRLHQVLLEQQTYGALTATLYKEFDAVNTAELCGYEAQATESNGPSGTLEADLFNNAPGTCTASNHGTIEKSASVSTSGTASVQTALGSPVGPPYCAEASVGAQYEFSKTAS